MPTLNDGSTNRFSHSTLHQRDSRSALFEGYSGADSTRRQVSASASASPAPGGYGYNAGGSSGSQHLGVESRGYRPATPNSRYVLAATSRGRRENRGPRMSRNKKQGKGAEVGVCPLEGERTLMAGVTERGLCDDAERDELWADEPFFMA